ncbi:MAG: M67 family metallopeptidase [Eubacteriales bacterium]|nr:M67 family metallopeptidase [Eubacteriales bacterium]
MIAMTQTQLQQFIAHAKTCLPEEACALLLGEQTEAGKRVREVYITENIDHTNEHFTITPQAQLKAMKYARTKGWMVLGNIHSHPETPARPSEEDKRLAVDPRMSYLIVSLMAEVPSCKAFRAAEYHSEPEELNIITEEN